MSKVEIVSTCPLGSKCEEPKDGKLYRCRWFVQLLGKDPQSEKPIEQWGCAIEFGPILQVEVAQSNRGTSQAVESLRNEMVRGQAAFMKTVGRKALI